MKTIEERAKKYLFEFLQKAYIDGATEQKAIDEENPSDELIMRILNAVGYEEESWIPFVRERLKAMEE